MSAKHIFATEILWQIEDFEVPTLSEYKLDIMRAIREQLKDAQVEFGADSYYGPHIKISLHIEAHTMGEAIDIANDKVGAVVQVIFPDKEIKAVMFTVQFVAT